MSDDSSNLQVNLFDKMSTQMNRLYLITKVKCRRFAHCKSIFDFKQIDIFLVSGIICVEDKA